MLDISIRMNFRQMIINQKCAIKGLLGRPHRTDLIMLWFVLTWHVALCVYQPSCWKLSRKSPKRRASYTRDALNQRLITLKMINKGSHTVSRDTGDRRDKGLLLHLWLEDDWTKLQTTGWLSASQPRAKKLRELNNPRQFDIRLSDTWNSQRSHLSGVWESHAAKRKKMDNGEKCVWYGLEWSGGTGRCLNNGPWPRFRGRDWCPFLSFVPATENIRIEIEYLMSRNIDPNWVDLGRMRIFWRCFVHLCIPIGYSCGPAEYWSPGGVGYFCTYFV